MAHLIGDMVRSIGLPPLKRAVGALTRLVPISTPVLLVGRGRRRGSAATVADFAHRQRAARDRRDDLELGLMASLTDALAAAARRCRLHGRDSRRADPVIEQGWRSFASTHCEAIVAFGGGSVMDAAKVIGLAAANGKSPRDLVGYFKGRRAPAPIYVCRRPPERDRR